MAIFLGNEINATERDITGPTPHVQIILFIYFLLNKLYWSK